MQKDDVIYRQAAIDICNAAIDFWYGMLGEGALVAVRDKISGLPPARLEPQEGEWVQIQRCTGDAQPDLECPFCKHRIGWFDMGRYCARCGAKLKGGAG